MLKFFALFALTVLATANAASAVTGASVTRGNAKYGENGDLVVKFTPTTALATGNTIKLTASSFSQQDFFVADNTAVTCTAALATGTATFSGGTVTGTKTILTLTLSSALAAGVKTTITCASDSTTANNLAVNGDVNNYVSIKIETTTDTTGVTASYTVTASRSVTDFSATRVSVVAGAAGGDLTFKFTPKTDITAGGTIILTPSQGLFSASDATTQCTATPASGTTTARLFTSMVTGSYWTADGYLGMTLTLTLVTGSTKLDKDVVTTVVCTSNLAKNSATVSSDGDGAGDVKFSIATSTDENVLAGQTGYTLTATSAASSTSSVSMLTMLALAGLAMRQ